MEINFKGKRALVTGAGKGIGRCTAKALAQSGAEVIALTRTQADLDSLVAEVPSIKPLCVDLGNIDEAVKAIEAQGDIHLLVNNAAVMMSGPMLQVKSQDFDKMSNINVKAPYFVTQAVARKMVAGGYGGAVVNVCSQGSMRVFDGGFSLYCSNKAALDMLTKAMALELGPHKIRVNSVNPTVVMTRMGKETASGHEEEAKQILQKVPLGRFAEEEDIANAILYLLSDKAAMVNGVSLLIDGGSSVH